MQEINQKMEIVEEKNNNEESENEVEFLNDDILHPVGKKVKGT